MKPLKTLIGDWAGDTALPELEVGGLSLDSRRLRAGDAFIAVRGEQGHGLDHLGQARAAGAAVILHDGAREPTVTDTPMVEVPSLAGRLAELARRMWDDPAGDLDLIAVTGTNGKSSVAWLLAQALGGAMVGTLGVGRPGQLRHSSYTTPDVIALYRALAEVRASGCRSVVLEASSHALAQDRLAGLAFTACVFTNLGHDHLDYHADLKAYGAAKARLFTEFSSRRQLICSDDAFGRELAADLSGRDGLITYGMNPAWSPVVLGEIRHADLDGLELAVRLPAGRFAVDSCLIGMVNALNLLVVAAELHERGLSTVEIADVIDRLEPAPGRMNRLAGPRGQLVVVDYAHSPDALENVLASLRELCPGQLWCVFGCGGERDRSKRPRMGAIAEAQADRVILTDDNPRGEDGLAIIREIQAGMARPDRSTVVRDRRDAIHRAVTAAARGDVVLVAGKGHETVQIIGDRRVPFSDFDAVREALEDAA